MESEWEATAEGVLAEQAVHRVIHTNGGESWVLLNAGSEAAFDVALDGLTALNEQRLSVGQQTFEQVGPGDGITFGLVSRLSLSGPANVVVSFVNAAGEHKRSIVLVPAP